MTKRLPPDELHSPIRRVNDVLRFVCWCPICKDDSEAPGNQLRVVKWRASGIRMECPSCRLRFTLDRSSVAQALFGHEAVPIDGKLPPFWPFMAQMIYEGG